MNKLIWIALVMIVVIVIALATHLYINYNQIKAALNANITYYENKTSYLENENRWLKLKLNNISNKLNNLSSYVNLLRANCSNLESKYLQCVNNPKVVEKKIIINPLNFSEWFKGMTFSDDYIFNELVKECSTLGELSIPCLTYSLSKHYIIYKTTGPDPFLNVHQTLRQGVGDCEEFASVEWAFLRRFKQQYPDKRLELMKKAKPTDYGMSYIFYVNGDRINVPGYSGYLMGPAKLYDFAVVCYNTDKKYGHCAVAISLRPLNNISDLMDARVFDPIRGELLGKIGEDFYLCNNDICKPNDIWVIIYRDKLVRWENGTWR